MGWAFFGGIAGFVFAGRSLLVDTDDLTGGPLTVTGGDGGGSTDALQVISKSPVDGP